LHWRCLKYKSQLRYTSNQSRIKKILTKEVKFRLTREICHHFPITKNNSVILDGDNRFILKEALNMSKLNSIIKWTQFFLLSILFIISTSCNLNANDKQLDFTSSNLPIIVINTHGQEIPYDDPRIVADMGIIYNGKGQRNNITDPFNNYDGKISIEIRGSSSAGWAKKSYGLETQNEDGSNRNVSLLGFPEENDWVLYAPYYDRSFLRNVLSFKLANDMGWYATRTKYCELVLNGEYQGIYVLMEKIKRDKNRVDIAKLNPDEISGDDLTGGYIIKIDKEPWRPGFDSKYEPFSGAWQKIRYQYHYPKAKNIVPQQEEYIRNFITEFEDVMNSDYYADAEIGYASYLNVESFVDHFILNELSKNVDAYRLSTYFYKDKDSKDGRLVAGPAWDFNFSFGNVGYYDAHLIFNWQLEFLTEDDNFRAEDRYQVPFWWKKLFNDLNFRTKIHDRWFELRNDKLDIGNLNQFIDSVADTLNEAQERNFQIWIGPGDPKLPEDGWFPPSFPIDDLETYADEIEYLKYWMTNRIYWMDQKISTFTDVSLKGSETLPADFDLKQNYPNPFNSYTLIEFYLPTSEFIELRIINERGETVKTIVKKFYTKGSHQIKFDSNNLVSGIYFYRLKNSSGEQMFKKMLLIK